MRDAMECACPSSTLMIKNHVPQGDINFTNEVMHIVT